MTDFALVNNYILQFFIINSKYCPSNSLVSINAIGTFKYALQVLDHKHDVHENEWIDCLNPLIKADRFIVLGYL